MGVPVIAVTTIRNTSRQAYYLYRVILVRISAGVGPWWGPKMLVTIVSYVSPKPK